MLINAQIVRKTISGGVFLGISLALNLFADTDRPNILWLTFEDTSAYEFACYGNPHTQTPTMDRLAADGIQFMQASSNAPQCSPVRSTIISGQYSKTFGSDWHRQRQKVPSEIYYFPKLLRDGGYFCTNNTKQDYNSMKTPEWVWDVATPGASYNHSDRKSDQPFFSVFNTNLSHMGRVRSFHTDERRDFGKEGLKLAELELPTHLPDLPEIRSDYAFHLEGTQDIDQWLKLCLEDLEKQGHAEDTIVFIFSDHGGCLPRGKGFLYQTGLHIPFIVYFPEKWKHLANGLVGKTEDLVGFVDLAPTVLELVGIEIPNYFQGRSIFGDSEKPKYQFGFRCNQEHHFDPVRSVFDGRYKYIRNFIPHKTYSLRNFYQWGMPANQAWDQWVLEGNEDPVFAPRTTHELYDTHSDPFETRNLAEDEAYQLKLQELETELKKHVQETMDLGFFPQPMREHDIPLYHWVRENDYPLKQLWNLCFLTGTVNEQSISKIRKGLKSPHPTIRYWAAIAAANHSEKLPEKIINLLTPFTEDENAYVSAAAAIALVKHGLQDEGIRLLLDQFLEKKSTPAYSHLEALTWSKEADFLRNLLQKRLETSRLAIDASLSQMLRSLQVNLNLLPYEALYPEKMYEKGLEVNHHRRALKPLP